jgi:anti-sigma-K factor RskA
MNHERFDELKDAFVLGALPEEERREFEEYLISHPERQAEVDELGAVAGLLALSPQEQEPPPDLRRRIIDTVEAVRPRESRRSWLAWIRGFLSARNLVLGAAALLVISLFLWNLILLGEIRDLQGRVQSLRSPQESRMVALKGPGAAHGARAEVIILEDNRAVLMAENMPRIPEEQTFQIWVIEGDIPKPSGVFEAEQESVATVVKKPLNGADAIAVSVEPEGGSPKPPTNPMLTAKL